MTVKHLQNVQRQQLSQAVATDPHTLHKFKSGFYECATEVSEQTSLQINLVYKRQVLNRVFQ